MYQEIAKMILYGDLKEDTILYQMGEIFRKFELQEASDATLVRDIYTQIKHLLNLATEYGFDKNLWHNYLTYLMVTNENSFSITCEKVGANDGSVNHFAHNDFRAFKNLFDYDFSKIEEDPMAFDPESSEFLLGDIVISMDKVWEQAENYGHSREREYAFLIAHSMLHLFGYDHMEEEERKDMEKRQEEILTKTKYTRDERGLV